MAFASSIHRSSVQSPLRFGPGISRARTSFSSSIHFTFSSIRHDAFSSTSNVISGRCYCIRSRRLQCFKETSQEDVNLTAADVSSGKYEDHEEAPFDILAGSTHTIYILEQSLSVDNLFVFVLIFKYFKVPIEYQSRVLSYGIAGAIIFRALIILLGTATIQRFEVVNLLLAFVLLFSSYKLFSAEEEDTDLADNFIVRTCQKFIPVTAHYDGDRFITIEDGVWKATPLLLTVAVIELSDIAFAVDSIPAVFGVTRDPFIVFSSNLFAISGLRSIYTLISGSMSELEYLQPAIGIVLGFIGTKMIIDFFGYHITTEVSLGFVAATISSAVLLSLLKKSQTE